jgi:ankyrin repeat protein
VLKVQQFLDAGANVNIVHPYGRSTLGTAAAHGSTEILKLLLEARAGINAYSERVGAWSSLQAAAERGYPDAVRMLLDASSDVYAPPALARGRRAFTSDD